MTRKANRKDVDRTDWLQSLRDLVYKKPLVIFRFNDEEWWDLEQSYSGLNRFTIARPRSVLQNVRVPTGCLLFAEGGWHDPVSYFALLSTRSPGTTLEHRVRIERAHKIHPATTQELLSLIDDKAMATNLRKKLKEFGSVVPLSPALSVEIINVLAKEDHNRAAMHTTVSALDAPRRYTGTGSLQQDAVTSALRAFGLQSQDRASLLDIDPDRDSALSRINTWEDAVIEEHARRIPSFELTGSDITGRAIFEKGAERLEVITANKLPLEEVLGVDLIYYNATRQNIVMVQYKMLNADKNDEDTDWIYRPNSQLDKEIERMLKFSKSHPPGPFEYRINPQVYYLKFVKRDAELGKSAITMPIDHFEVLRNDPMCKGKRGALRISYDTLDGRYLRQMPFFDLIRSGYIGAYADTTAALKELIDLTLENGRAVVAAVQRSRMMQTVGILAYGSLIADPGREIKEVRIKTIEGITTPFPVEYARSSAGRGGAPTLVPYEGGGQVRAQVFVVDTSVEDAADRLYRREIGAVGSDRHYKHSTNPGKNTVVVDRLEGQFGLDVVLYTRIAATIDEPDAAKLAQLAIKSVAESDLGKDGITYLMNAMQAGIETPLTAAYADEVKRLTGASDLSEALTKLKKL